MKYRNYQNLLKINSKIMHKLYYFVLGIIAFSALSQYIMFKVMHIPLFIIEIYFIPFFIYSATKYISIIKRLLYKRKTFLIMIYIIITVMLIGILYSGDPINVITMTRSLLYIVLLLFVFSEDNNYSIANLQIVVTGAIIGEFINALFFKVGDIASLNSPALALMILIPIVKKKNIQFILFSIFGLVVAINSGYRMSIVSAIAAIFLGLLWMFFHRGKNKNIWEIIRKIFILTGVVAFIFYVKNNFILIVNYMAEKLGMSTFAVFRVTTRLIGLFQLNFTTSQDGVRFNNYSLIINSFIDRVLPRGLVGKSIGTLPAYIDVPITYFYDAFGSIGTIVILSIVTYKGVKAFLNSFEYQHNEINTVCGLMFPIYILLFVSNGSFLYITYQCILTGIVMGSWFKHSKVLVSSSN